VSDDRLLDIASSFLRDPDGIALFSSHYFCKQAGTGQVARRSSVKTTALWYCPGAASPPSAAYTVHRTAHPQVHAHPRIDGVWMPTGRGVHERRAVGERSQPSAQQAPGRRREGWMDADGLSLMRTQRVLWHQDGSYWPLRPITGLSVGVFLHRTPTRDFSLSMCSFILFC